MSVDVIWWVGMTAAAVTSVIIGYRWGFRNGRKAGFESGKRHGRFWADWDEKVKEL